MPRANKKPMPSTIPYPQAWLRGEAEGPVGAGPPAMMLVTGCNAEVCRAEPLGSTSPRSTGAQRGIYTSSNPLPSLAIYQPSQHSYLHIASKLCGLQARHDSAGADWLEIVEHSCMSKICMVGLNQTRGELPHKSLGGRLDQREMGCNWFASEFYCRVSRCADKQTWDFERATAPGRVRSAETFFFDVSAHWAHGGDLLSAIRAWGRLWAWSKLTDVRLVVLVR